jgi:fatty-acid peroxygenase
VDTSSDVTDLALHLLRDGYAAVARDRSNRSADADYETWMLGRRAVVLRSPEGARLFYDESVVRRRDAVPPPLAWLLFGRGAVHAMDDAQHRDRKELFLQGLTAGRTAPLAADAQARLSAAAKGWASSRVDVFDELVRVYGAAVIAWAGIEVGEEEAAAVSRRLATIVDGFGFAGPAYAAAWRDRLWADRWAKALVEAVRAGRVVAKEGTMLNRVAAQPTLDSRTAGVELLNVLCPTVAVAWLGVSASVRLTEHPDWRSRLAEPDDERARLSFAQEVRRTTLFVPALAGRARARAEVCGLVVHPRDRVVLDVVGINHDPARWPEPEVFRPGRFLDLVPGAYDLVPQGGGAPQGHRCPGEDTALALLGATLRVMAGIDFAPVTRAPADGRRIPARPAGHGRILVGCAPRRAGSTTP